MRRERHANVADGSAVVATTLTKDFIIERYADLFDGVGLLNGEVHLQVDRTVPPVQCHHVDFRSPSRIGSRPSWTRCAEMA